MGLGLQRFRFTAEITDKDGRKRGQEIRGSWDPKSPSDRADLHYEGALADWVRNNARWRDKVYYPDGIIASARVIDNPKEAGQ